jgi:hypothetical protein
MIDKPDIGMCEHCGGNFPYALLHNGFNESAYAYCGSCGMTTVLDACKVPEGIQIQFHAVIKLEDEGLLLPCECGGAFKSGAYPRCPLCRQLLSAELAKHWIEANAPGTGKGWRWQCAWTGLYAIVIDNKLVRDNWKPGASNKGNAADS